VTVRPEEAVYSLRDGHDDAPLELRHHGEPLVLTTAAPVIRPIPALAPPAGDPTQPPGRSPVHRENLIT
jgi:alpha,alpha-trehalose phosphorylase